MTNKHLLTLFSNVGQTAFCRPLLSVGFGDQARHPRTATLGFQLFSPTLLGGTRQLLKGWTREARGEFTDHLTRARRHLAPALEVKLSGFQTYGRYGH